MRTISTLGQGMQWYVGASSIEQWFKSGYGDEWWCVLVCWIVLWGRGTNSHRVEYMQGVSTTVTQIGYMTVQDGTAITGCIQWSTGIDRSLSAMLRSTGILGDMESHMVRHSRLFERCLPGD